MSWKDGAIETLQVFGGCLLLLVVFGGIGLLLLVTKPWSTGDWTLRSFIEGGLVVAVPILWYRMAQVEKRLSRLDKGGK